MLNLVFRNTVKKALCLSQRRYCRDIFDFTSQIIPIETKPSELPAKRKISKDVISQLEAISLVNFGDEEGIKVVEEAISYADKLEEVNTDGVKPLCTVLENECLYLREDNVKSDVSTADLLSHAEKTFEGYYIAPVGNIPYNLSSDSPRPLYSDSSNTDKENNVVAGHKLLGDEIQKMLRHFQAFNFLQLGKNNFNFGYNGERLKENILNEWLLSNSITCDEPSFLAPSSDPKSDFWNSLIEVWSTVNVHPCNIVVRDHIDKEKKNSFDNLKIDCDDNERIISYFKGVSGLKLQRYLLFKPQPCEDFFFKLQRERQIWWKKFSASPGRFSLSEINHDGETQVVDVNAEFSWGNTSVEKIKFFKVPNEKLSFFEPKSAQKSNFSVVSSEMMLERSALTFLCDSFEVINEDLGKNMMRFHRKLAPFKISFSASASTSEEERDLKDLALLLTKQIRKYSTSVLLLPDICSAPVQDQICRNDSLGIPYTIIMDSKTLTNGLLGIRSRDTTLQEQSHVGSLIPYVEKLMKNY